MKRNLLYILLLMITTCVVTSCKEESDSNNEFSNWQSRNNEYFNKVYKEAQTASSTNSNIKILRSWSLGNELQKPEDHIVVKVLENGTGTKTPVYNDSVYVHVQKRLIPSATYPDGKIFSQSWTTEVFNPNVSAPIEIAVNAQCDGFATALQHMHVGDRWRVYVPYALSESNAEGQYDLPSHSMRIYDVTLAGIKAEK